MLDGDLGGMQIGTFHRIAARLLRRLNCLAFVLIGKYFLPIGSTGSYDESYERMMSSLSVLRIVRRAILLPRSPNSTRRLMSARRLVECIEPQMELLDENVIDERWPSCSMSSPQRRFSRTSTCCLTNSKIPIWCVRDQGGENIFMLYIYRRPFRSWNLLVLPPCIQRTFCHGSDAERLVDSNVSIVTDLPFKVVNTIDFDLRREVRDIVGMIHLAHESDFEEYFKRLAEIRAFSISKSGMKRFLDLATIRL